MGRKQIMKHKKNGYESVNNTEYIIRGNNQMIISVVLNNLLPKCFFAVSFQLSTASASFSSQIPLFVLLGERGLLAFHIYDVLMPRRCFGVLSIPQFPDSSTRA